MSSPRCPCAWTSRWRRWRCSRQRRSATPATSGCCWALRACTRRWGSSRRRVTVTSRRVLPLLRHSHACTCTVGRGAACTHHHHHHQLLLCLKGCCHSTHQWHHLLAEPRLLLLLPCQLRQMPAAPNAGAGPGCEQRGGDCLHCCRPLLQRPTRAGAAILPPPAAGARRMLRAAQATHRVLQ